MKLDSLVDKESGGNKNKTHMYKTWYWQQKPIVWILRCIVCVNLKRTTNTVLFGWIFVNFRAMPILAAGVTTTMVEGLYMSTDMSP